MKYDIAYFLPQDRFRYLSNEGKPNFSTTAIISESFNVMGSQPLIFVGYCVMTLFISGTASSLASFIPAVGNVASMFVSAALFGGFLAGAHHLRLTGTTNLDIFFSAFKRILPLGMVSLLTTLFGTLLILPILGVAALTILMLFGFGNLEGLVEEPLFWAISIFSVLLSVFLYFCVATIFMLAAPIVLFSETDFWEAMMISKAIVTRNFFGFGFFNFMIGLVAVSGMLLFGIGVIYTLPTAYIAYYILYGRLVQQNDNFA